MAQYIHDKNGKIFLRQGTNIRKFGFMIPIFGKLVCGVSEASGAYPSLVYADWDTVTECGTISGDTVAAQTITSQWFTKVFWSPHYNQTKLRKFHVLFRTNASWTSEKLRIHYRRDCDNDAGTISWTEMNFEIDLDGTLSSSGIALDGDTATHIATARLNIDPGFFYQFKFEFTGHAEVIGYGFNLEQLSVR